MQSVKKSAYFICDTMKASDILLQKNTSEWEASEELCQIADDAK